MLQALSFREVTRTTSYLFTAVKQHNLPRIVIMVDFEKAFCSVNLEFILAALDIFEFGDVFKEWIKIILGMNEGTNFSAVTDINRNISKPLCIQRGCRQGDPIAGFLFFWQLKFWHSY